MITKAEIKQLASEIVSRLKLDMPIGDLRSIRDGVATTIEEWLGCYSDVSVL